MKDHGKQFNIQLLGSLVIVAACICLVVRWGSLLCHKCDENYSG